MRAVIIANGKINDYEKIKSYLRKDDCIICADGGYEHALKLGAEADVLLGDMDSVKSDVANVKKIVYPKRKDFTDSELVVDYAVGEGFKDILLLGFTGGRADHMLTNIAMLARYPEINIMIADENSEIILGKKVNRITGKKGDLVSIIPINGDLTGVTTDRLEYPLDNETLHFGYGRGVSNVMCGEECTVTFGSGNGLIIKSYE